MTGAGGAYDGGTAAVAERVLSAALGGPVRLGVAGALQERATVDRFAVAAGPPGAPASVVVKRVAPGEGYDPATTAFPAPAWFLFNNWAGLAFLGEVAGDAALAPRCYGGDRRMGVVVLEDLGDAPGLDDLLLGDDAVAAQGGLLAFATLLGRLHARTAGHEATYLRLRGALGPIVRTEFYTYAWLAEAFARTLAVLGLAPVPGAEREVRAVITSLREPGPWLTYTHGDPCPDNCLLVAGRATLIDFDLGEFRHALTDGVFLRHFRACWCARRTPVALARRMEAAYRAELARGCPAAADDEQFQRGMAEACAYWALEGWQHNLPGLWDRDRPHDHGLATMRETTLSRVEQAAQTSEESGHLRALGATFRAAAARLRARWELAEGVLPHYPALSAEPSSHG